jgi:hypothetical protein
MRIGSSRRKLPLLECWQLRAWLRAAPAPANTKLPRRHLCNAPRCPVQRSVK